MAAAPVREDIAVPVEAVPKVVATHMAAVGAMLATAAPPATPAATAAPDLTAASIASAA